jgi:hypothetical protein
VEAGKQAVGIGALRTRPPQSADETQPNHTVGRELSMEPSFCEFVQGTVDGESVEGLPSRT